MAELLAIIQTIAMVAIPLLSAIVSAFYWIHRRIEKIEKESKEAYSSIYGSERDPLSIGIAREVNEVKKDVNEIKEELDERGER